jgi:hypothetical protein
VIGEAGVVDYGTYKVSARETTNVGIVYSTWFSVYDTSDPFAIQIVSSTGDKLVNGKGDTQLSPVLLDGNNVLSSTQVGWKFYWYFFTQIGARAGFVNMTAPQTIPISSNYPSGGTIPADSGAQAVANIVSNNAGDITIDSARTLSAGDIVKAVNSTGTVVKYYEVAASSGSVATLRVPSTNTWLTLGSSATVNEFSGGKLYRCVPLRTSIGMVTNGVGFGAPIYVSGDDVDTKCRIDVQADMP